MKRVPRTGFITLPGFAPSNRLRSAMRNHEQWTMRERAGA